MAVVKFRTCLTKEEYRDLEKLKEKYFRGNRAATIAAGIKLLKENVEKK